jgi:penicillin-binding protein 1A
MKIWDSQKGKETIWAPTNADGHFSNANMPLKTAFAQSINSVAVKLGQEMGIDRIAKTAHAMGIKSPLNETPSLALGSSDVNLLELVNAYSTIINDGKAHEPIFVTRIKDRDGHDITPPALNERQAINYRSAYLMQQMLMAGMRVHNGTSMSLWRYVRNFPDTEFGGKTGTSNNHSDAWFVGVSPKLICGAWVGGEYRAIHFRTGKLGQGSRTALPICGMFFESVLSDKRFKHYRTKFTSPKGEDIRSFMYDCSGYVAAPDDSLILDGANEGVDIEGESTPTDDQGEHINEELKEKQLNEVIEY